MRTDDPGAPALNPFRAQGERVWKWLNARGTGARRTLLLGLLAAGAVAAAVYAVPSDPVETATLFERKVSPSQAQSIKALLLENDIRATVADGRVRVPADRLSKARKVVVQNKLAPVPLTDILKQLPEHGLLDTPADAEAKDALTQTQAVEELIENQLDEVLRAEVMITPQKTKKGARDRAAKAVVRVTTEGDRPLTCKAVKTIHHLLMNGTNYVIAPASVTVLGQRHQYLMADDEAKLKRVLARAHEEEVADEVLSLLGAPGARVEVTRALPPAPAKAPRPVPAPPALQTRANEPVDQTPEPEPSPAARPGPAADGPAKLLVTVRLPRRAEEVARGGNPPGAGPSSDVASADVDRRVRDAVAQVVPPEELGGVEIVMIDLPEAPSPAPTVPAPAHDENVPRWSARSPWVAGVVIGSAAALGVAVLIAGGRKLASRRPAPARLGSTPGRRHRFDADDDGPGPSERVRDLVRRSPEAAAGVLQRWVGQGGHTA